MAKRVSKKNATKTDSAAVEVDSSVTTETSVATMTEPEVVKEEVAPSKAETVRKVTAKIKQPNFEEIRMRAFEIFLRRNGAAGDETSDWLQAERELYVERTRDLKGK